MTSFCKFLYLTYANSFCSSVTHTWLLFQTLAAVIVSNPSCRVKHYTAVIHSLFLLHFLNSFSTVPFLHNRQTQSTYHPPPPFSLFDLFTDFVRFKFSQLLTILFLFFYHCEVEGINKGWSFYLFVLFFVVVKVYKSSMHLTNILIDRNYSSDLHGK
jgi:ABC-type branched-subunit amino acid transport system permease subunit